MTNPFYIGSSADYSQGLMGMTDTLRDLSNRKQVSQDKEQALSMKKERARLALEAYNSNDSDKIAEFVLRHPSIGKQLLELVDRRKAISDNEYATYLEDTLINIENNTGVPEDKILTDIKDSSYLPNKIDIFESIRKRDPDVGQRILELELAKIRPERYEKWLNIFHPEEEEKTPSSLGKLMTERDTLIKKLTEKGVENPLDDPDVKAYNDRINEDLEADKEKKISPLKRLMIERDELVNSLIEQGIENPLDNPDIMAYNNKIIGEGVKNWAPSALRKLMTERDTLIEKLTVEGVEDPSENSDVKAYNNRIAGIDIDIKEMTQDEIDVWGAWVNINKGKMPSVGRGKQATKIRARIMKSAAAQALGNPAFGAVEDMTPSQAAFNVVTIGASTAAIQGAMNYLEKQLGSMGSFVQNMDEQISRVSTLSEDLKTFDTRLLNIPLRLVRGKIIGSPLQAKYDMYLTEIESEIGRLASGSPASIAELSISAQEKWAKIHDKNLSVKDMLSLLRETRHAANIRLDSVGDQLERTKEKLRGTGVPQISSQGQYDMLEPGDFYIDTETGDKAQKPLDIFGQKELPEMDLEERLMTPLQGYERE